MAAGNNPTADQGDREIRTEERVAAMDRIITNLVNTARLGLGFVTGLISIFSILVGVFIAIGVFLLQEVSDLQGGSAQQTQSINQLDERVRVLTESLGDTPDRLQQASTAIEQSRTKLADVVVQLDQGATRIEQVSAKVTALDSEIGVVRASLQQVQEAVVSEKSPLLQNYTHLSAAVNAMQADIKAIKDELSKKP